MRTVKTNKGGDSDSSSSGLSGNISAHELDEMHFEKRHFETQVGRPKRASHLEQYQLTKASHLSTHMQKGGTKGSKQKDGSRFLHTQNFDTRAKGKPMRNVQIDLGSSSAGRLNTSSHQPQLSSPGNKLHFQNNVMSRMAARQTDL